MKINDFLKNGMNKISSGGYPITICEFSMSMAAINCAVWRACMEQTKGLRAKIGDESYNSTYDLEGFMGTMAGVDFLRHSLIFSQIQGFLDWLFDQEVPDDEIWLVTDYDWLAVKFNEYQNNAQEESVDED